MIDLTITTRLGSQVPVITNSSCGIIGRDAVSDEFKEVLWDDGSPEAPIVLSESANGAIMLVVGFLPGLKVGIIPLLKPIERQEYVLIDKFVRHFEVLNFCFRMSISCCHDMFSHFEADMNFYMGKIDEWLSPETIIVGDSGCQFRHTAGVNGNSRNITVNKDHVSAAVALVFVVDKNKNPGIGETQFHAVLSCGLLPVGPTYKAAITIEQFAREADFPRTWLTAVRERSSENIGGETIMNHVYDELGDRIQFPTFYIRVTKKRKCAVGQENFGHNPSLAFHKIVGDNEGYLFVCDTDIKMGDTYRVYYSDSTTALSSVTAVSNHMRSLNQSSTNTAGSDKQEVFGGLIFTCDRDYSRATISWTYRRPRLPPPPILNDVATTDDKYSQK